MTAGLNLGAPGVYPAPASTPGPDLRPVRLDVTGFVGVSFRGPVDEPVPVGSWSEFVARFGGITAPDGTPCPGLLPLAVRAFFDQGGTRAVVDRVAPVRPDPQATAAFELGEGGARLVAASEGRWGDRLTITLGFEVSGCFRPPYLALPGVDGDLPVPDGVDLPVGSLLRLAATAGDPLGSLHWVDAVRRLALPDGGLLRLARLTPPAPPPPDGPAALAWTGVPPVALVTGTLRVDDADPTSTRTETVAGLGLRPDHPRYPPSVLAAESLLVRAGPGWSGPLLPPAGLVPVTARMLHGGADRFAEIDVDSLFDPGGARDDPLDERTDHRGVDRIGRDPEIGLLCVPDLTWSWQDAPAPPPQPPDVVHSSRFRPCLPEPPVIEYLPTSSATSHLDPGDPAGLAEIVARQRRLVEVAELRHRFVALLDAPSRLSVAELGTWRSQFDSSYAAGYHPWLGVPDPRGGPATPVPPSAFAAGIAAARELGRGLSWGPANELAVTAVTGVDAVTDAGHDRLHLLGINVFRAERDGFRLTAARTLAGDPAYRQLSVRRLMTMIALSIERQAQWLVFEPNTPGLRATLNHVLTQFLGDLFRTGALAGATERESFFVRCDDELNPPLSQGLGRLVAEVGVAPAYPLEYLVLRLTQDADGAVQVAGGR